ncbi:S41 family peptidase [Granulicella sp. S156]|jgi:Peptidase family S41|uniref:S41 family peptidase n=1 Tax=Granulicella sp. S156 TaxID=1747224 RepID=UPI00131E4727|nr:S41 family peptidase [Granulicella sp. S156]
MSEKLYAFLLYLYPSTFRAAHGEDALQLFRDRLREETGFFRRTRLWLDIFRDLATSLPHLHRHPQLAFAAANSASSSMFLVLEEEPIRPTAFLSACAIALVAYSLIAVSLNHTGKMRIASAEAAHSPSRQPHAHTTPDDPDDSEATTGKPSSHPGHNRGSVIASPASDLERQRVLGAVIANLKQHYFDPVVAQRMADALVAHRDRGDDAAAIDEAFAALLTAQMRDVSQDPHLQVIYNATPLPQPSRVDSARMRADLQQENCFFRKVQILPHNVGYLKLDGFPDPIDCGPTATAAMESLNQANALIFDLRDNRGGTSEMVSLISSYLFDHPKYIFDPRRLPTPQSWTASPVAGSKLADKPVYILTSSTTISAAEQFTYDLRMLSRATIIGEVTAGGAHAGAYHRIDDHYAIAIPETRIVNPYGQADWEAIGIQPDIKVPAAEALKIASQRAESQIQEPGIHLQHH